MEVIPLENAMAEVEDAAKPLMTGRYHEANQALKSEDGARCGAATFTGTSARRLTICRLMAVGKVEARYGR